MTRHTDPHAFHRHLDLGGWYDVAVSKPVGRLARARRLTLLRSIEAADIDACHDIELLRAVAEMVGRAHLGRDPLSIELSRLLPRATRIRVAAAAEAQISRLFLEAPELSGALEGDISLLRGCIDEVRQAG